MKVPTAGGPLVRLAEFTARPAGAAWRADGTIVFASAEGLFQTSDQGGTPRILAKPDREHGERLYAWPEFLPTGDNVLFTILPENRADAAEIVSLDLKTGARTLVIKGGSSPRYLPTGQLVFMAGSTMKAVRFDAAKVRIEGEPVPVQGLDVAVSADNGAADFAIAPTGTLIYLPSASAVLASASAPSLGSVDAAGVVTLLNVPKANYRSPRVSPDGKRVAVETVTETNQNVILGGHLSGTSAIRRLTQEGNNSRPAVVSARQQAHRAWCSSRTRRRASSGQRLMAAGCRSD